jgi:hypothetical protein
MPHSPDTVGGSTGVADHGVLDFRNWDVTSGRSRGLRATVIREYAMQAGRLVVTIPRAMRLYAIRRWVLDRPTTRLKMLEDRDGVALSVIARESRLWRAATHVVQISPLLGAVRRLLAAGCSINCSFVHG